jgi:competence protein ComEC
MVPIALAVTAGIVVDRYASIPFEFSLILAVAGLMAWICTSRGPNKQAAVAFLVVSAVAVGAAYHHYQRDVYPPNDIGAYASCEARLVRLQGVLEEEPTITWQPHQDELRTIPRTSDPTLAVLRATRLQKGDDWIAVSGRVQLVVSVHWEGPHVGDEIEVVGYLAKPSGPANPGEFDHAAHLRDQHIQARLLVRKTPDVINRLQERWPRSFWGWLAVLRGWGQRTLRDNVPHQGGLAMALLLGDGSTMTSEDWEKYVRTGVIHVLAISGQHLVVLAFVLWLSLRVSNIRRRWGAIGIALFLLMYSLLAGGRPPVMRSAVTVCVVAGGLFLRRPTLPANSFAFAWLVVAALNPTDLFTAGCQLSFLSVAILYWGASRWFHREVDPLERLVDQTRPAWLRGLRWLGREIAVSYAITLAITIGLMPLVASRYHVITLHGLLIGPPLALLTSIALLSGFGLLACAVVFPPIVPLFAYLTGWSLSACESLVDLCDGWRWARWYVPDVPEWWLWIFYPTLLAVLMLDPLYRRWRWAAPAGLGWVCVLLVTGAMRPTPDEMRCTFLAVGHGGCTVIETPDGRTLLYDAGAMTGPDVTRRQIAPFLWSRGLRRIDEVFLTHGDLDHFNGLPALMDRFAIGQVTCTPTFADKKIPGVPFTLRVLEERGIRVRIARSGDRFSAGEVSLEVLHPPAIGPEGNENARSLVLLVRHAGHSILLTGDLEGPGLERVLKLPALRVDVLMAPHHGSRKANLPQLAEWATPWVVLSSQGPPRGPARWTNPYTARGAHYLTTFEHGAIEIRSTADKLTVETFLTGQRFAVARGKQSERP